MQFSDLTGLHETIKDELDNAIQSVISRSAFINGPDVLEFERNYAELVGRKHCVSCANGTDAIYISLRALGVGVGDEVITTAHTWIATSETITQTGAQVVFADTEPHYFTICPKQIRQRITPKTKGIIVVHLYGQPADMDAIMAIAKEFDLWVIEDCAQAHLAEYKGQQVGTIGDIATFSFYPGKNLGAMGDAGAIVTNRADLANFCRLFARHGGKNNHVMEGINSRMDGMQAAILNVKMQHLSQWTLQRQQAAELYNQLLPESIAKPVVRPGCTHVYHLYVIKLEDREFIQQQLKEQNIPTIINYPKAVPFYPAYKRLQASVVEYPMAHANALSILSLPIHPLISEQEIEKVAKTLTRLV